MNAMNQGASRPSGSWTHSFEEDEAGLLVYRPTATFAFPPSRGARETFVFGAGGEVTELTVGPDDRPRASPAGLFEPLGMNRYAAAGMPGAPERVIEIVEATAEILKVRKH